MAVSVKVNGDDNSLVHKGSNHICRNTPPDVCKTPSPGGPVPIPYPVIISMSSDLDKGTTTVKVDGGNMAAIKGSELSRCSGDEAGTAGGVVSSTNMKEATWITYSMNVKMDGQGACRLTDKLKMNHGNTVCMEGIGGMPCRVSASTIKDALCQELCNYQSKSHPANPKDKKSYNLERKLEKDPKWAASGITFTTPYNVLGAVSYPDVSHHVGPPYPGGRTQCFDFKLCGLGPSGKPWQDTYRGGKTGVQYMSQTAIGGGKPPITISCKECTKCNPRCHCPK